MKNLYKLKNFTKYFNKFPINKHDVAKAILNERNNLKKIVKLFILK